MAYLIKIFLVFIILTKQLNAEERIKIIGSSTIFPFMNNIAEEFSENTNYPAPIIESVGTGGGFKLFCSQRNKKINIANASRLITDAELKYCHKNGYNDLYQFKLGYDGVVLANMNISPQYSFTSYELFLALSEYVPVKGKIIKNPYKYWDEINDKFPHKKIRIYGPAISSGTRDVIIDKIIRPYCLYNDLFVNKFPDLKNRENKCSLIRSDKAYVNMAENDNLIVHKLIQNPDSLGFFGYYFLFNNEELLQASKINEIEPFYENIKSKAYILSRPLYIYIKDKEWQKNKMLAKFIKFLSSKEVIGSNGLLIEKGFIPLKDQEFGYNHIYHLKN